MRNSRNRFIIRKNRVRHKLLRITSLPRLSVFKSSRHIYVQIIDDKAQSTLVSASTLDKELSLTSKSRSNKNCAQMLGKLIADRAYNKGIKSVVFDKGGYKYHGVLKALADSAREKLEF